MDYDRNTLLWIKSYAQEHPELTNDIWNMVYDSIIDYNRNREVVAPKSVYTFIMENLDEPDVVQEAMKSTTAKFSQDLYTVCNDYEINESGDSIRSPGSMRGFIRYIVRNIPDINRDGLCLWIWLIKLECGGLYTSSKPMPETIEEIRSLSRSL